MSVHVSIHDVSPAFERQVRVALAIAAEFGARPSLLVVPNYHACFALEEYPRFCDWLRRLEGAGHELVLHGLFHRADETRSGFSRGAERFFAQRVVSSGEAEFAAVGRDEAERRLREAEHALERVGLRAAAFVAPAWTMPRFMPELLGERGYRYSEDHFRIYDPAGARARVSLLLNFAARTKLRMASTIAYCRAACVARAWLPTRIAIHPKDVDEAVLRHELRRLLAQSRGNFVRLGRELFADPDPGAERGGESWTP